MVFVEKNATNYIGNFHNVFIRFLDSEANRLGYKLIVSKSSASKVEENFQLGREFFSHESLEEKLKMIV